MTAVQASHNGSLSQQINHSNRINGTEMDITTNRDDNVVNNTLTDVKQQIAAANEGTDMEDMGELTAEQIKFASLLAQGYSGTQAYRISFPAKSKLKNSTVRYNVVQLLANPNIKSEIAIKRTTLAQIARLSEDRIIDTLIEAKTGSKSLTDTMLAMYEHANGKAKQTTEVISKSVSVNIDLTAPLSE